MTILQTVILGIVEGITEFLPVSSTAHLEFSAKLMGVVESDFVKSFIIAIQLGAILAVVVIYRKRLLSSWKPWFLMVAGFIPTGIIGFALYKIIKGGFLGNHAIAALVLALGGVVMILVEKHVARRSLPAQVQAEGSADDLSYADMAKLGLIQSVAVVPGVSRSGAIIVGGLLMKMPRATVVDAAFLLAIPTMFAATGYDLLKTGFSFSGAEWMRIGLGALVAFAVGFAAVKWLLSYVRSNTFVPFGWYRIVAGLALAAAFLIVK